MTPPSAASDIISVKLDSFAVGFPSISSLLHPGKAARIDSGWVGELHPATLVGWSAFELDLATLFERVPTL